MRKDGASKRLAAAKQLAILVRPRASKFSQNNTTLPVIPSTPAWDAVRKAFAEFQFDPSKPSDWLELMGHFADAHFGTHKPGRSKEWTDEKLIKLWGRVGAIKAHRGIKSDGQACEILARRDGPANPKLGKTYRRKLQDAKNPKRNYTLAVWRARLDARIESSTDASERAALTELAASLHDGYLDVYKMSDGTLRAVPKKYGRK
jgi:hypothetical protein